MVNSIIKWSLVVAVLLACGAIPASAGTVCPAINANGFAISDPTGCDVLFTINANLAVTVTTPSTVAYDGSEDQLIGILNNSNSSITSLTVAGVGGLFGFDGDGVCGGNFIGSTSSGVPGCSGTSSDSTGYAPLGYSFTNITSTSATLTFPAIAGGGAGFFSLEGAPTAGSGIGATVGSGPLYDPNEPGSVLVFPKFVRGTVAAGVPATEIEISVHCPIGLQPCAVPGTSVRLMGHWVCPGQLETQICKENNFIFTTTVEGTVSFNTEGSTPPTNFATVKVPAPLCPEGYLIVWAVDIRNRPIKFDGLVGDAIVRWNSHAAGSYKAIAIQADPALANNALLLTGNAGNGLVFDGGPGHYVAVTGTVMGSVKYDTPTPAADAPVTTTLTLLTLDTLSNRPNNEVFTDIDFYDANENVLSDSTNYTCWTETALSTIDPSLTRDFMSRKGFFVSLDATKVAEEGIADNVGPVSQLGLIDTQECAGSAACSENVPVTASNNPTVVNHYAYRTDDDSIAVPTTFVGP